MHNLNWDNLRYVLTVAAQGSIAGAARELGVNRSTVLRRIENFQESLDCRIFLRTDSGYVLTAEAEKMVAAAREVENALYQLQRDIAGHELRLEGELRVTTTDGLMSTLVGPAIASFHRDHPKIVIDLTVTNHLLDLNRRDADIAIRPTSSPPSNLVAHRLRDVEFGLYASEDYLKGRNCGDLKRLDWIGLDSSSPTTDVCDWLKEHVPPDRIRVRADSFVTIRIAVEEGLGVAPLPTFFEASCPTLKRLDTASPGISLGLWALTHPDLVRSARIQAFLDHLKRHFAAQR